MALLKGSVVRLNRLVRCFVAAGLVAALAPASAFAATINVNTTADELNSDGDCSLREAIEATNDDANVDACAHDGATGADTINLAGQPYTLSIPPDASPDDNQDGDLDIHAGAGGLTLDGAGQSSTTLDANDLDRLLHVASGPGPATISDLTVQDGTEQDAIFGGGGILAGSLTSASLNRVTVKESTSNNYGGGVGALGPLSISNSTIGSAALGQGNQVIGGSAGGGGVYAQEGLTLANSTVTGNQAAGPSNSGGGIELAEVGSISNSEITGNGSGATGAGVRAGGNLTISGSQISGNQSGISGGAIQYAPTAAGTLDVSNSEIFDNEAVSRGGGMSLGNAASLELNGSTVSGNTLENDTMSAVQGGGIFNGGTGETHIAATTISGNTSSAGSDAGAQGGGLFNATDATTTVERSTISGNSLFLSETAAGGAILNQGTLSVVNSTLTGNLAQASFLAFGGAVRADTGSATLSHATIASNTVSSSGGKAISVDNPASLTARGTIVSEGSAGACAGDGVVTSAGYNIERTAPGPQACFTAATDLQNTDPVLGPLATNGGPTQTLALTAGSPAIDFVPNAAPHCTGATGTAPLTTDQRGLPRPSGSRCDAGAFEVQVPGGGGGGGAGGGDALVLALSADGKQKAKKLEVDVGCGNLDCSVELDGTGRVPTRTAAATAAAKAKKLKLKPKGVEVAAGSTETVRLKFKKHRKTVIKVRELLKEGGRRARNAKVVVSATATGAGGTDTAKEKIKLKR
ncbi:MAG: choice-of-anchor Q domain-containing protein [Solirubrobacterales bacterium]